MLVSRMIRLTNRTLLTKRYYVRSDDKLTDSLQRGSCDARKCGRELGESLHDRWVGRARDLQLPNKAFGPHQFQQHHHLSESASAKISNNDVRCVAHVSNFANSIQCSKASPHCHDDPLEDATTVRMLEHTRYEAAALMPDCPTKGNPARHMPTRLLAVSSRKRYCLVTGPRYCKSPLCLERLLYSPGQSNPTPYHLNSMHASLNAN